MITPIKFEMIKQPLTISKNSSIRDAHQVMIDNGIRHLPVVENENLLGIVSERDILSSLDTSLEVESIMTLHPFIVEETEELSTVVDIMAENKFGSVLIVNKDLKLTGIFTTIDALRILSSLLNSGSSEEVDWNLDTTLKEVSGYSYYS